MSLRRIIPSNVSPSDVLYMRDRLQVQRVAAVPPATSPIADVIELESLWDGTDQQLIDHAVGRFDSIGPISATT